MSKENNDAALDDSLLVSKIVATNNTHLFAVLYDRYAEKIYNKCLIFSKSPDEAQDLTHDIFIQLFLKLRTYKSESKFSTWLYAFTYNFCLNYVQRDKKKKQEKFTDLAHENYSDDEISDDEIYKMKAERLMLSLNKISPDDKMILLMKYQDDFSIAEIQQGLGLGESAVKMRLKRAKERLINIYNNP